jgi:hypothetical protein
MTLVKSLQSPYNHYWTHSNMPTPISLNLPDPSTETSTEQIMTFLTTSLCLCRYLLLGSASHGVTGTAYAFDNPLHTQIPLRSYTDFWEKSVSNKRYRDKLLTW